MPYGTRKVRGKNCYKVYNLKSKKVFSKCTSRENANRQITLLKAIHYNPNFVPRVSANRQIPVRQTPPVTVRQTPPVNNRTRRLIRR